VDVDHAQPRQGQNGIREDSSVRRDHSEVSIEAFERVEERVVFEPFRLKHRQAGGNRPRFHRGIGCLVAAAAWSIGLRDDGDDVMA
jgi:hypothetical protein